MLLLSLIFVAVLAIESLPALELDLTIKEAEGKVCTQQRLADDTGEADARALFEELRPRYLALRLRIGGSRNKAW